MCSVQLWSPLQTRNADWWTRRGSLVLGLKVLTFFSFLRCSRAAYPNVEGRLPDTAAPSLSCRIGIENSRNLLYPLHMVNAKNLLPEIPSSHTSRDLQSANRIGDPVLMYNIGCVSSATRSVCVPASKMHEAALPRCFRSRPLDPKSVNPCITRS